MSQAYPQNDYRYYLKHSFKGTTWKKEDAKYLYKKDGRYYYPEDVGADEASERYRNSKKSVEYIYAESAGADEASERYRNRKKSEESGKHLSIDGGVYGGSGRKIGMTTAEINKKKNERKLKDKRNKDLERISKNSKSLYDKKKAREKKEKELAAIRARNEAIRKENASKASINKYDAEKKLEKKRSNKVEYTLTAAKSYAGYLGRRSKAKIKKLTNALSKVLP